MNRPASLTDLLEQVVNYSAVDPNLRSNLRHGLSQEDIASKLHQFPFQLPQEVEELYQWHDGINVESSRQLFHYHCFLPLDEALAIREEWLKYNTDFIIYEPNLLPLFEFQGEYYAAQCSPEKQESAPIWFVFHDSTPVYDSLKSMFSALLECYTTGAYQSVFEDGWVNTTIDEKRVAEIKLKYNPIRQEVFDLLLARQEFYYHP